MHRLSILLFALFLVSSTPLVAGLRSIVSKTVCNPEPCDCTKPGAIDCDNQQLATAAVAPRDNVDRVTVLSLKSNGITVINALEILNGKGKNLNRLYLSDNQIDRIQDDSFATLVTLEELDLSNNRLSNLSKLTFNGLSNLLSLRLDHNLITNLSSRGSIFAATPRLRYLSIDYTPIKQVSNDTFAGLDSLIELSIDHAELSFLPNNTFKSLIRLETLSLRHNRFHVIPLDELQWLAQLKRIDLSGNPILTINSNAFRQNGRLRDISFINMPYLAYVEDCAFCNLHELRSLQIINCSKFNDFDPEAFGRDNMYFRGIETIDLVNNSLETLDDDTLPWGNVSGMIRLSGNPWKCDCNLLWMMEPDLKLDKLQLPICASPSNLKGQPVSDLRKNDSTFCILTRLSARIRTARLFLIVAVLIVVTGIVTAGWYLFTNRRRNGLKLSNLFYKPQLPKYAYRNLAMGDEMEQESPQIVTNDGDSILPKNGANKNNRDLATRLADEA